MGLAELFRNGLFAISLLLQFPTSIILRKYVPPKYRFYVHILIGIPLCLLLYQWHFFLVFLGCMLSYFLLYLPGSLCLTSITVPTIMLFFIHYYKLIHFGEWASDVSGLIMFSFLRIWLLAFNVFDGRKSPEKLTRKVWKDCAIQSPPSILHYLAYLFTYSGLYSGPFLPIKDFIALNDLTSSSEIISRDITAGLRYEISGFLICAGYAVGVQLLPAKYILSDEFKSHNFIYRLLISIILSAIHTSRYVFAWFCAESSWRALGGAEINEERISSIVPSVYYTSRKLSTLAIEWNRAIHFTLKECLHVRLIALGLPPIVGKVASFAVSAMWHGFYSGYYLFAVLETCIGILDEFRYKYFTLFITDVFGSKVALYFDIICVQSLNYFMGAPWDLYWSECYLEFYSTMKYAPFFIWIALITIGFIYCSLFRKKKKERKD